MLFISLVLVNLLALQTIQFIVSPAAVRAMAMLQNQRVKALSNVLKAQAQYNAARARTNLGLLDHRVIRNSDNELAEADNQSKVTSFEDIIPQVPEGVHEVPPPDQVEDLIKADNMLSTAESNLETAHRASACSDIGIPGINNFNIPSQLESNHLTDSGSEVITNNHHINKRECQSTFVEQPTDPRTDPQPDQTQPPVDDILGSSQTAMPFQQGFAAGQTQFGQPILINVPSYMPQSGQFIPAVPYQGYPLQPMSPFPAGFAPQMILVRQASPVKDDEAKSSFQIPNDTIRVAAPHLRLHDHSHIHSHVSNNEEPFQRIQIPTQVLTPGMNLHVIQNQNAGVIPQTATAVIQPGFNTGGIKMVEVADGSMYRPGYASVFTPSQMLLGPGIGASQSQNIRTVTTPIVGSEGFVESQELYQDTSGEDDEKVGSFMTDFRARAPESPEDFDPNRPKNLQPVVNYIEGHEHNMKKLLKSISHNDLVEPYSHMGRDFEFVRSPNPERDFEDEKLGTIGLEPMQIHLNPPPTLPQNFIELNSAEQRDSIQKYLDEEKENAEEFLEEVDENSKRTLNGLISLIDAGPTLISDFEEDKPSPTEDTQSEITGNVHQHTEPDDQKIEDMLTKFIENSPEIDEEINGLPSDNNLGNIIDVPQRQESDWYTRFVRSLNKTNNKDLDELLQAEKEVIHELKKDAKHDEDLMMIGYIGENMIKDLERRQNATKRTKREIGIEKSYNLPLHRLIQDPKVRLNIPKSLDNLGTVAKNAFEHEKAPLYHVRNMVGSAQDAVLATMKIPSQNLFIPSQYDIVRREQGNTLVADIDPRYFSDQTRGETPEEDGTENTFQRVGSAIRSSVHSGQEALGHVGQAANHAKSAIHSTKYAVPRLILKEIAAVPTQPRKQAVLVTPRIFDIANGEQVGSVHQGTNSQGNYVKLGHILDAIGVSNPNSNDVQFDKITVEPSTLSIFNPPDKLHPSKRLQDFLASIRVEEVKNEPSEDYVLGDTMGTLENIRESLGVNTLKDIFVKIKDDLGQAWDSTVHRNPNEHVTMETKLEAKNPFIQNEGDVQDENLRYFPGQSEEVVQASMIPESLVHPFMGQVPQKEIERLWNEQNGQASSMSNSQRDRNLGQILGAINPMMFEKIFNESLKVSQSGDTPHSSFHHHHDGRSHGFHDSDYDEDDDDVATNMKMHGAMLKPFMGQAKGKMKHDFFHKYMPDSRESIDKSHKYKKVTNSPDWYEVLNNGGHAEY